MRRLEALFMHLVTSHRNIVVPVVVPAAGVDR